MDHWTNSTLLLFSAAGCFVLIVYYQRLNPQALILKMQSESWPSNSSWTVMKEINNISLDAITCTFSLKKSQAEALVHRTQSLEGLAQPKSSEAPMNTYMFKLYELAHFTK
ncbi:hypothetical protein B0H14DRAFT_2589566 [Mycena olivaceomarginata]|nr:hypothetical protein B0H14DRAFT_2589566 [Mycena olivaceomarginata]